MIPSMDLWFTLVAVIAVALIALGLMANALRLSRKRLAAVRREADRERVLVLEGARAEAAARNAEALAMVKDQTAPVIFAIRAELGALSRMTRGEDEASDALRGRLTAISESLTQLQQLNTQVVERLRREI